MRRHFHHHRKHFYGSTTLGEKGQVVIPAEAREELSLEKGEKLLVFGLGKQVIALTKLNQVERILGHLENKLNNLKEVLRKTKNE
jgi:AbrB family looped-hinge helix DNA binding protein